MHQVVWPDLAAALESVLVNGLALEPLPIDPALARAEGRWKGAPATIETRAWRGARIAYCRVARVASAELAIGNVLCLPDPALRARSLPLPVLGADLVGVGARDAVVVADLSPTGDDRAAGSEVLGRALAADPRVAALPRIADLPAWARESFSPAALAVRVAPDDAPVAAAAVRRATETFVALVGEAGDGGDAAVTRAVHHSQQRYLARHRVEDAGLALLARVFGAEWAERYIRAILFPELS